MRARPLLVLAIAAVLSGAPSAASAADPSPPLRPVATPPPGTDGVGPDTPAPSEQSPPASTIGGSGAAATPAPQPYDPAPAGGVAPINEAKPVSVATAEPDAVAPTSAAAPAGEVAVHVAVTSAPASLASPHAVDRPPDGTPAPAPIETTAPAPKAGTSVSSPDFTFVSLIAGITALAMSAVLLLLALWRRSLGAAAASAANGSASGEDRVADLLRRRTERLGRIPIEDDPIVAALNIPPPTNAGTKTDDRARGSRTP